MSIETLKQALEALELLVEERSSEAMNDGYAAITALRTAIEQAEKQEAVAFALRHRNGLEFNSNYPMVKTLEQAEDLKRRHLGEVEIAALYTTPPAAVVNQQLTTESAAQTRLATREEKIVRPGVYEVPEFNCPRCGHCCSQRQWVGLTDEEISEIEDEYIVDYRIPAGSAWNFAKDIEAKLREKNGAGQRLWIGLTQEQRNEIVFNAADEESATYQTEDKLRELNGGQT